MLQSKAKRILCCGDRNWDNLQLIEDELLINCENCHTVIHGDCRGADKLAGEVASDLGMQVIAYPADWEEYGKKAGPIRNSQMLKEGKPDFVLAFHNNLQESKGTADMVRKAKAAGVHVKVISE